jgi:hypothetical protein
MNRLTHSSEQTFYVLKGRAGTMTLGYRPLDTRHRPPYTIGVAKLTVYVPDELVIRLQPFRDELNLSEIAKAAIEERLRGAEQARAGDVRLQVLTRLRRGDLDKAAMRARGFDAGRLWAKDVATWTELKQIAAWPEITASWQVMPAKPGNVLGAVGAGLALMAVSKTYVPRMNQCFVPLSVTSGPPPGTKEDKVVLYWQGFAAGVSAVHELVKDQMDREAT